MVGDFERVPQFYKQGAKFSALFNGIAVLGSEEKNERSLMARLAVHTTDKEKLLRVFRAKESARLQSSARNELKKTENRLSEIEKIIVKLYEEKVCGTMPEERFELLAKNYETEQTELKEKVIRVKSSLTVAEENDSSIAKFISLVRSYTEVNELTPEILNSFIDKIYIGKPERINGQRVQEVKIVYKLVGAVNIPQ